MKWTDKQFEAISDRGHNLLVAAAAGSGKTAVLVERIKTLILKDGCPIDRMLVVTFTNAAASEMKEKIEKAIREEITGLSVSQDADKNRKIGILKRQLDLLPMANISTFHSFSMEVVKRFFFVIGCEPNFKICDEANKVILEDRAMDKLMERRYEEGGEAFLAFLDKFSGDRSDDRVRSMIKELSDRLDSMPEPEEWLDEKTEALKAGKDAFMNSNAVELLWQETQKTVDNCIKLLKESVDMTTRAGLDRGSMFAAGDLSKVAQLAVPVGEKNYEETKKALSLFKLDTMRKENF
ncbi:MAG: UvrD-helicase domain-containing protein, partial [Firmicutes bacterium]|nr:UvrD-helicase domain-containing protein [Bacillota bacterium]